MEILTNVQLFLLCPDGDVVSFTGAEQTITMELASAEIEDHIGIEMLPVEAGLKMERALRWSATTKYWSARRVA